MTDDAPLLELHDATIYRGETCVFDHLTLTIPSGRHCAILGPNGAGKSTLIKLIHRELYPFPREGSYVRLFGKERWVVSELRQRMGIVSPEIQLTHLRPLRAIEVAISGLWSSVGVPMHVSPDSAQWAAAELALDRAGALHLASRPFRDLSSGEQRRVLLARALVRTPSVLLLDEPTANLDLRGSIGLISRLRALAQGGTQIVVVTHQLEDLIPEIEHLILLRNGTLFAEGSPERVLTSEVLSELYGARIQVLEHQGHRRAVPA